MEEQRAYEVTRYEAPLTAVQIKAQVQLIQEVMAAVMEKDVHYGVIPGTQKPTLYKPGSEKILSTFRIAAYPKEILDLSTNDEIRYQVKVHGLSMNDGRLIGVGIGECSSSEEKYKWRRPVCDEEFTETPEDRKRLVWKKYDGQPKQQKQVRMNPSDVANTILKMAKKRAQIDMTLTATAASDVFDQDLEEMTAEVREQVTKADKEKKPPLKEPEKKKVEAKAADQVVITTVSNVESKKGTTKKKDRDGKEYEQDYVMYGITGEGDILYKTFSETFADIANTARDTGEKVKIVYQAGRYGNSIIGIAIEEREPGDDPF